jgi:hypothetical protein
MKHFGNALESEEECIPILKFSKRLFLKILIMTSKVINDFRE